MRGCKELLVGCYSRELRCTIVQTCTDIFLISSYTLVSYKAENWGESRAAAAELPASSAEEQKASENQILMKTRNKIVLKGKCSFCFKELMHFPERTIGISEPKYLQIKKETY